MEMTTLLTDKGTYNAEEVKAMAQAINFGRDIGEIKDSVKSMRDDMNSMKQQYVTRAEWMPVRTMVYGFAALVLVAVVSALIALVLVPRM